VSAHLHGGGECCELARYLETASDPIKVRNVRAAGLHCAMGGCDAQSGLAGQDGWVELFGDPSVFLCPAHSV
jgi:hypothetical protein